MKLCLDCLKEIKSKKAKRCRHCSQIEQWSKKSSTKIKRFCKNCGIDFLTPRSQVKAGNGFYCNRKCFWIYFKKHYKPTLGKTWKHTLDYKHRLSKARKGKNNPSYKHGGYCGIQKRGKTQRQKLWGRKVFKRDYFTCQKCGARNGNGKTIPLEAHHIKLWAFFKKDRFKIGNCITLCRPCHRQLHKGNIKSIVNIN